MQLTNNVMCASGIDVLRKKQDGHGASCSL